MPQRRHTGIVGMIMVVLGFSSLWQHAWAWGDLAHTLICEIAFQELGDQARAAVVRLLQRDPTFSRFNASCTWPDHPRQRAPEHYVDVPRDVGDFTQPTCPQGEACVLTAIAADLEVLQHAPDDEARLAALKFVGHWVGDMHQPLHVACADDRGGNLITIHGVCQTTLHSVWDTCLVVHTLGSDVETISATLRGQITPEERARWQATPVVAWANELLALARQVSVGYCVLEGARCGYTGTNPTYDAGEPQKAVTVDAAYLAAHAPLVARRLQQAGVRLGQMLNQALGSAP